VLINSEIFPFPKVYVTNGETSVDRSELFTYMLPGLLSEQKVVCRVPKYIAKNADIQYRQF